MLARFSSLICEKICCYMTPIKDLLWMAETSLHWLWQIMMSNSDELRTLCQCWQTAKIDCSKSSPGDMPFFNATWQLKIDIETLNISQVKCLFTLWEQHLTHLCRMEFHTIIDWNSPFLFKGILGVIFYSYSSFDRKLCKQTVETLIRRATFCGVWSGSALFAFVPQNGR